MTLTFPMLIEQVRTSLVAKEAAYNDARYRADRIKAECEKRRAPFREDPEWLAASKEMSNLSAELNSLRARADELDLEMTRDQAAGRLASEFHPGASVRTAPVTSATTTRSRDVYDAESDRTGRRSFFADMFNAQRGDVEANQRFQQFQAENRAAATSSFAGLVVPQYLTDQAALLARAGRPFADTVTRLQIPEQGQSFLVPRGTTGATVAVQASENTNVSSTDEVWSNVTLPVATIAGQQDVSRQSLERGDPGLDSLIFADLAGAYAVALDAQVLSGSGSAGQVLGVLNTAGIAQATAFTAAVTIATFWTKVAGSISSIATNRFIAPTHIAMHPRRYAWLCAQVDSQGRPLVLPSAQGPENAMGNLGNDHPAYGITPGTFQGLQIVVDANLPTSAGSGPEDQVIVYRAADILLYEHGDGTPVGMRFEQTLANQLTVKLVSYGYAAFTAGRYPAAVGVIGGNAAAGFGLIAPTF